MPESTSPAPPPTLRVDDLTSVLNRAFSSAKESARQAAEEASTAYAGLMAGAAAHLLRLAFGPNAHRAVFANTHADRDGAVATLVAVYDNNEVLLWYSENDAVRFGSNTVHIPDVAEPYAGPPNSIWRMRPGALSKAQLPQPTRGPSEGAGSPPPTCGFARTGPDSFSPSWGVYIVRAASSFSVGIWAVRPRYSFYHAVDHSVIHNGPGS